MIIWQIIDPVYNDNGVFYFSGGGMSEDLSELKTDSETEKENSLPEDKLEHATTNN